MGNCEVDSLEGFIIQVREDYASWGTKTYPWFRGEPETSSPLVPTLYRKKKDGTPLFTPLQIRQ